MERGPFRTDDVDLKALPSFEHTCLKTLPLSLSIL